TAAGDAQQVNTYRFDDAPEHAGTWYYRLLQFDRDGAAFEKAVIAVHLERRAELRCHPVPADLVLWAELPEAGDGFYELIDVNGRTALRGEVVAGQAIIPTGELPGGMYTLRTPAGGALRSARVMVAH
ncbi:MAG TPA: hypothetical protein VHL57_12970, partial [Flavobacteriales bacterium]|nr:hypothetical protein [Flavobacteriales bacterium]